MLNTDLHSANIKPERRMNEEAFVRNNVYYGDDICHGRRIPEDTLRGIYREIKQHPIAPPVVSLTGVPLQGPAVTGSPTKENVDCAVALAGRGEPLASLDFGDLVRLRTSDLGSEQATRQARAAAVFAALPEVWHACTRVGLATFTCAFEEPFVGGSADGAAPPASTQAPATPLPHTAASISSSAARQYAWEQLDVLVSCAQVAEGLFMHSGLDIVVAALCKVAGASLRAIRSDTTALPSVSGTVDDAVAAAPSEKPPLQQRQQPVAEAAFAAFVADARAHMALAAALWLASQHSGALSTASWQCVLDCLFRLQRAGLVDLSAQPRHRHPEALDDAPSPLSADADGDAALQHLLQAYSAAVVKLGRLRRQKRAEAAHSLAEAMVLGSLESPTPSSPQPLDAGALAEVPTSVPSPREGAVAARAGKQPSLPSESAPATLDSSSSVTALLSWLFGSENGSVAGDSAHDAADRDGPGSSADSALLPDAVAASEWAALRSEEPVDELSSASGGAPPRQLEGTLAKLISAARGLWADLVDLDDEAASRVLAALVKLAGLPCPLALDVAGGTRGLQPRPSEASAVPSETPQRVARSASPAPSAPGDRPSDVAGTFDDGAAFIGTMESARFKCSQLPPPPEPRAGSHLSRLVLRALGLVAQCAVQGWSERLSCTALVVCRHALECVLAETTAVTRRVRTTLAAVAAPCVSALLSGGAGEPPAAVLGEAVGLLWFLCTLPVPAAGAARLQVSWLFSSRVRPRATPQLRRLWALRLPADVAPAAVQGLLSCAAAACSGTAGAALDDAAPRHAELSAGRALEATLAACGLPSWEDEDTATPFADVGGSPAGASRREPSTPSPLPSLGLAVGSDGALSHDELHALELVSATSARAALGFVSVWAADEVSSACRPSSSSERGAAEGAVAVLDALAVFIHRPLPTSTLTVDDLGVDAIDALGVTLLLRISLRHGDEDEAAESPGSSSGGVTAADRLPELFVRGLQLLAATVSDVRLGVRLHALHTLRQVGLCVHSTPRSSAADERQAVWPVVVRKVLVPLVDSCVVLWGDSSGSRPRGGDACVHTVITTIASVAEIAAHAGAALLCLGCVDEDAVAFVEVLAALRASLAHASSTVVTAVQPAVEACLERTAAWIGSLPSAAIGPAADALALSVSLRSALAPVPGATTP